MDTNWNSGIIRECVYCVHISSYRLLWISAKKRIYPFAWFSCKHLWKEIFFNKRKCKYLHFENKKTYIRRDEKMQHSIMVVVMMIQRDMCSNFILFSFIQSQCCYNETNHMRFVGLFVWLNVALDIILFMFEITIRLFFLSKNDIFNLPY